MTLCLTQAEGMCLQVEQAFSLFQKGRQQDCPPYNNLRFCSEDPTT
jgi:hypothetical protein